MDENKYFATRGRLEGQRSALIAYLRSKLDASDWHAVQDAGSDIREIESQLDLLEDLAESTP